MGLGRRALRALLVGSKLPGCSIRHILLADVLADLLEFEPDRGDGNQLRRVLPRGQRLCRELAAGL